jgi:hypothetical protein
VSTPGTGTEPGTASVGQTVQNASDPSS